MSEQDDAKSSTKHRRSRKTSTANQQNGKQAHIAQRPTSNDTEGWKAYWKQQNQSWRTEPEIDSEQQQYLAERRAIVPNIEKGIYPFKDIKLSRADVEWLLITHENGRGPVDWDDVHQREREGLDIRGADLSGIDLQYLPLARMKAGLTWEEWSAATDEQRDMAVVHLEGTDLYKAHLEHAVLRGAHLERADLSYAYLEEARLFRAHLEGANLFSAHLEGASLRETFLGGKKIEQELLYEPHFPTRLGSPTFRAGHKDQIYRVLNNASLKSPGKMEGPILLPTNLQLAIFDHTTNIERLNLGNERYGYTFLVDVRWNGVNLAVIDWTKVKMLGEEYVAHQRLTSKGVIKDKTVQLDEYRAAVRVNRQLATILRDQGLNEEADYFAYRAQLLQRKVWQLQQRILKSLLSWFLYFIAGYGYRPRRSVIWYLVTIFGCAFAYFAIGHLPFFPDAFVFSLTSFHGRGFFPGLGTENSLHNPLVIMAAFEAVIGLLIEISFIATFTQRFFGR